MTLRTGAGGGFATQTADAPLTSEKTALAAAVSAACVEAGKLMAQAYLNVLHTREAREGTWFPAMVDWGMRVVNDDDALLDRFSVSRATLKRWANAETSPGPLARESVLNRMEQGVCEKHGLKMPQANAAAVPATTP